MCYGPYRHVGWSQTTPPFLNNIPPRVKCMQKPKINGDLEDAGGMMRLYLEVKSPGLFRQQGRHRFYLAY
jgi:hypothetical protein